jgi:alanyl-tRNA synthetase
LVETPFYAESGGQVGDTGWLKTQDKELQVLDTQKSYHQILMLVDTQSYKLHVGQLVHAVVDQSRRMKIAAHHTATHLLHAALRTLLGPSVQQKGSLVTEDRLRFDFSYEQALTDEQLAHIERYCQEHIDRDRAVVTQVLSKEQALEEGALAFFEEKYGQTVRVLTIGDGFSKELCGGTHVHSLKGLMTVVILSEEAVASGVRRLQAVAGDAALAYLKEQRSLLSDAARALKVAPHALVESVFKLQENLKAQHSEWQKLAQEHLILSLSHAPVRHMSQGYDYLVQEIPPAQGDFLKMAADLIRDRREPTLGLLTCLREDKLSLVLTCSSSLVAQLKLKNLFDLLKNDFNLKGGGRPELIQAGAADFNTSKLKSLVQRFEQILQLA